MLLHSVALTRSLVLPWYVFHIVGIFGAMDDMHVVGCADGKRVQGTLLFLIYPSF